MLPVIITLPSTSNVSLGSFLLIPINPLELIVNIPSSPLQETSRIFE